MYETTTTDNAPRPGPPRLPSRRSSTWLVPTNVSIVCCVFLLYAGLTLPIDMRMIRELMSSTHYDDLFPSLSMERSMSSSSFWRGKNHSLHIVWLMSFPNSGTSFTIKNIRHLGMTQSATNYGHENTLQSSGESIPIYGDQPEGPFWTSPDLHPEYHYPARLVMVKTHCGGRCESCPPQRYLESTYSFRRKCLTGKRRSIVNGTRIDTEVTYPVTRVSKAIHLIRDPFDNVVSRYHMELKRNRSAAGYSKTRQGFRQYCYWLNNRYQQDEDNAHIFAQSKLLVLLKDVPCRADFIRYVEWHNQAFSLTQDLRLESIVVHYDEYSTNRKDVTTRLLRFLDLSEIGTPYDFIPGKVYRKEYFTGIERRAVHEALQLIASHQTWTHIGQYFEEQEEEEEHHDAKG